MNSLYGKTIQAVELVNEDTKDSDYETEIDAEGKLHVKRVNKTFRAGGLFNPFIATLITGKVRAMIHTLEHKFKALHTATDSIKTLLPVTGCSNELGGYKHEVTGTCLLFRNKLYLHFAKDYSHCSHDPKEVKIFHHGQHLCKFALHGFTGRAKDLMGLYHTREKKYKINHLFKIREALIQKQIPLAMVKELERKLNMNWENFVDAEPKIKDNLDA